MFNFKLPWPRNKYIEEEDAKYIEQVCDVHRDDSTQEAFAKIVKVLKRLRGEE